MATIHNIDTIIAHHECQISQSVDDAFEHERLAIWSGVKHGKQKIVHQAFERINNVFKRASNDFRQAVLHYIASPASEKSNIDVKLDVALKRIRSDFLIKFQTLHEKYGMV